MINAVVIDKNQNSRDLISSYLNNIEDIVLISAADEIENCSVNLGEIDLIIFDIASDNACDILLKIKSLKSKYKNLNFIATSYDIDSELVTKTLKENVRDFLIKPLIPNILEASVDKIKDIKNNTPQKIANTVCIFSNKGGIGKTTLAINLAYEMSQLSKDKICLLDFSYGSNDSVSYLNIKPKYAIKYILENVKSANKKLLLSLMNKYKDSNMWVLSTQNEFDINIKLTPALISEIINSLKTIFEYIIIDTSNIVDENLVCILNNSDLIIYPVLQSQNSLRNCQKCFELFDNMSFNNDKIKLVINRFSENSEINTRDIEKITQKSVFAKIPNNYLTLIDAINQGSAVEETNPHSNIAKSYKKMARDILNMGFLNINEIGKTKYNHGIYNLLRRMGD